MHEISLVVCDTFSSDTHTHTHAHMHTLPHITKGEGKLTKTKMNYQNEIPAALNTPRNTWQNEINHLHSKLFVVLFCYFVTGRTWRVGKIHSKSYCDMQTCTTKQNVSFLQENFYHLKKILTAWRNYWQVLIFEYLSLISVEGLGGLL